MLFRKKSEKKTYDRENQRLVLHCSICNGEQIFGFKDIHTGKFEEIAFIRNEAKLKHMMDEYGVTEITKKY